MTIIARMNLLLKTDSFVIQYIPNTVSTLSISPSSPPHGSFPQIHAPPSPLRKGKASERQPPNVTRQNTARQGKSTCVEATQSNPVG